jgi:WD40 repeat protein/tetratricopeptide (TPR) repeat protein
MRVPAPPLAGCTRPGGWLGWRAKPVAQPPTEILVTTTPQTGSAEAPPMKYWAFISHSSRDAKRWALPLRNRLEAYRVPKSLVGTVARGDVIPRRLRPVFRDRDELTPGPDLPQRIRAALEVSRYLVVVCSPDSKASAYVGQEILWFKQLGRADRILAYVVEGEPAECFREELLYEVDDGGELRRDRATEPLAADARPGRDGQDAVLKVIAGILGASFDELKRRELQRRQRLLLGVISLTASVALALTALAAWALLERDRANGQTVVAQKNERAANEARDNEAQERARAVQRLVRMLVADGWRAFGDGDALAAVPLFVQALEADRENPPAERVHRLRVAATLRRCPRLTQVWFPERSANAAAFSPDGRLVLTAGGDGQAQVWDVESGQAVGKPLRQGGGLGGAAFSPDGKRILTWGYGSGKTGGGVRLWDAATGEPLGGPVHADAQVNRADFSSNGRYVKLNLVHHSGGGAVQGIGYSVAVHDGLTGRPASLPGVGDGSCNEVLFAARVPRVLVLARSKDPSQLEARVWDLESGRPVGPAFDPGFDPRLHLDDDGDRVLAVESLGERARVWDAATGKALGPGVRHGRRIVQAALSPDGERLVTVSEPEMFLNGTRPLKPGEARVWDVDTGRPVGDAFRQEGDVESAAFAAGGDQLVTRGKTEARVWDVSSGQPLTPPLRHRHGLTGARVSPDARRVLTWGLDGSVRLWDLAVTDFLRAIHPEGPVGGSRVHFGSERRVEFSPDGKRVVVNVLWGARAWDAQTGQPLTDYRAEGLSIGIARFSPDGRLVAGGGSVPMPQKARSVPTAYVWDAERGEVVAGPFRHEDQSLAGGSPAVQALAFHPDGHRLATGAQDGTVRLWDVSTGKPLGEPLRHRAQIQSVAFSADGSRLLTVAHTMPGEGAQVRVWDTAAGTELAPPLDLPPQVRLAALRPDGRRVVVGAGPTYGPRGDTTGTAGVVEVRAVPGGAVIGRPMPQPGSLAVVAFSPDGRRVFAGCTDGSARLYDADTGTPVTPVLAHPTEVSQVAFSRDGRVVICCCGTAGYAPTGRTGEVRVWDAETGELAAPPLRHLMSVRSVALDPREETLVAGGEDLIRFWDLAGETRPAEDLRLLARLLSETEIDARSHVSVLSPAGYRAAWERYRQRNPPGRRGPAPDQVLAWHTREAIHAEAAGEWRTADRHLEAFLAARPKDEQLHARRGFARHHLEDWAEAAAAFGRSLELGNTDWNVRYHRGLALAGQEKWADAVRDYDAVLREIRTEWEVYHQRGRAYHELGRHDRAEADCTEAIAVLGGKRPEYTLNPLLLEQQAHVQLRNGKWQPWFTRGLARQDSGQYKLAAEDYGSVLEAKPGHLWALCNRGTCRRLLGEYDAAVTDFDAALKGGLDDWRPWAGRGWVEAHRGRWPQAGADYAEALRRNPGPTDVWLAAALVRLRLGDRAGHKALCAAMRQAVADRPLGARLQAVLVCALAADSVDDWQPLRQWCEEGRAKKVNNIGLLLGAVLYRQGRFEQAREHLRATAAGASEVHAVAARLLLAMACHRGGQGDEAAAALAEARRTLAAVQASGVAWTDLALVELLRQEADEVCHPKE